MQKIIGICGFKGSGKDTIGDIICELDDTFEKASFADILKDVTSVLFGWDRDMLSGSTPTQREEREQIDNYWSVKLGKQWTPRLALQILGTEIFRQNLHQDIWVHCLERKIIANPNKNFVITDVRFNNEIKMIKRLSGKMLRVERGERPVWWNLAEEFNTCKIQAINGKYIPLLDIHASERDWIGIDDPNEIFKNDGTIDDLKLKVEEFLIRNK